MTCPAKNAKGGPCRRSTGAAQYCEAHDPVTAERRKAIMRAANVSAPRTSRTLRSAESLYEELERELRAARTNADLGPKERVDIVVKIVEAARKLRAVALEEQDVEQLAADVRAVLPDAQRSDAAADTATAEDQ